MISVSTKLGKADETENKLANKAIWKMQPHPTKMKFTNHGPVREWMIKWHGDARFKNLSNKMFNGGGQLIKMANQSENKDCTISGIKVSLNDNWLFKQLVRGMKNAWKKQ